MLSRLRKTFYPIGIKTYNFFFHFPHFRHLYQFREDLLFLQHRCPSFTPFNKFPAANQYSETSSPRNRPGLFEGWMPFSGNLRRVCCAGQIITHSQSRDLNWQPSHHKIPSLTFSWFLLWAGILYGCHKVAGLCFSDILDIWSTWRKMAGNCQMQKSEKM